MRTLLVLGTRGGAGVTTLVALAFTGLRETASGPPRLVGPEHSDVLDRAQGARSSGVTDGAVWDAGVLRADAQLSRLSGPAISLALVAPATPVGTADAFAMFERVMDADPELSARSCVVLTGVHGRIARKPKTGGTVLFLPNDPALAQPGPVASDESLRPATRNAVSLWRRWAGWALYS